MTDITATLDRTITDHMRIHHIVGLSVCRFQDSELVLARGYGWADIAGRRPMTPDVIQNIGSISKTFTGTALMQLWEQGFFQLDDPVNGFLPFQVYHPQHETPITFRHLLTHTSAIQDSPAYPASYAPGDPSVTLHDWLQSYLLPDGSHYDAQKNFLPYAPGTGWTYSNVAYGLLGYLVEVIAGQPFHLYCREKIFHPLGMDATGWLLSEIDLENHAVPYALPELAEAYARLSTYPRLSADEPVANSPTPLQLYSFPNYPDGLVRTSARQLAVFGAAFAAEGERQGSPLLKAATVQRCFTQQWPPDGADDAGYIQGLTWRSHTSAAGGADTWGHDGGDPGINTRLELCPQDGSGIVLLANSNHTRESMDALTELLWAYELN